MSSRSTYILRNDKRYDFTVRSIPSILFLSLSIISSCGLLTIMIIMNAYIHFFYFLDFLSEKYLERKEEKKKKKEKQKTIRNKIITNTYVQSDIFERWSIFFCPLTISKGGK